MSLQNSPNRLFPPRIETIVLGKQYSRIDDQLANFIARQQVFFVATAPLSSKGLVNVSPKGLDSFRILDEKTVVYADLIGSGIETVAHVRENGRIVIMFCAFEGGPKIVRLHGRAEVIEEQDADFETMRSLFPTFTGLRCFLRVDCQRISDSCGFGVPLYTYEGQREQLTDWAERKGKPNLGEYIAANNASSLDGLPGLDHTEDAE